MSAFRAALRQAIRRLYSSPVFCRCFCYVRVIDAVVALILCAGNGVLTFAESVRNSDSNFESTLFCWLSALFAFARVVAIFSASRNSLRAVRCLQEQRAGAVQAAEDANYNLVQEMLASSMVFVLVFTANLVTSKDGLRCAAPDVDAQTALRCSILASASYVFIGVNSAYAIIAAFLLLFDPTSRSMLKTQKGLPAEVIGRLQSYDFDEESTPSRKPQCAICLEDVRGGERVRCLPCGHEFHARCVDAWLGRRAECPMRCKIQFEGTCPQPSAEGAAAAQPAAGSAGAAAARPVGRAQIRLTRGALERLAGGELLELVRAFLS